MSQAHPHTVSEDGLPKVWMLRRQVSFDEQVSDRIYLSLTVGSHIVGATLCLFCVAGPVPIERAMDYKEIQTLLIYNI